MTVEDACRAILGTKAANAIIESQGVHWAIVAAMVIATTADDPDAIQTIREHNAAASAA